MASYWQISRVQYSFFFFFSFQTKNWDTLFQTQKYIKGTRELLMIQVEHWGHRRKGSTTLRQMGKYWSWCWFWIFLVLSSGIWDFFYTHKFLIGRTLNHMLQKLQLGLQALSRPGVFHPAITIENPPPCTLPSPREPSWTLKRHSPAPHNSRKYGPAELSLLKFAKHGDSFGKAWIEWVYHHLSSSISSTPSFKGNKQSPSHQGC